MPEIARTTGVVQNALTETVDRLEALPSRHVLGKGPNRLTGFHHNHSGMSECGMAYRDGQGNTWRWTPCKKYVNHDGECGYEDNTAF